MMTPDMVIDDPEDSIVMSAWKQRWRSKMKAANGYYNRLHGGNVSYRYSVQSQEKLSTVDPRLAGVLVEALKLGIIDIYINFGARDEKTQNRLFSEGKSKVQYPNSKHNIGEKAGRELSEAVDAVPYISGRGPLWDRALCCFLAGIVLTTAHRLGVPIRWGGNWDQDGEPLLDQGFDDLAHFELVRKER